MNYCEDNELQKIISHICTCEYTYFLNKANVVGIGCGYKIKDEFYTNQLCIQVFTVKKLLENQLNSQNIVPSLYKGIPTDVIETGDFLTYSFVNKIRPVICGYGIGNEHSSQLIGTLGCLVTDGNSNYILSCNHVLANYNTAPLGTKIIQPSSNYGGNPNTDTIATLSKFIPIKYKGLIKSPSNYTDCAIAKVINSSLVYPEIAIFGKPHGIINASLNEDVQKVGEKTELTHGKINSINATITLNCQPIGKKALFKNQVLTTIMSNPGDSGAMLLDKNMNIIGMLIAGSQSYDAFSSIDYILKELNVNIIT